MKTVTLGKTIEEGTLLVRVRPSRLRGAMLLALALAIALATLPSSVWAVTAPVMLDPTSTAVNGSATYTVRATTTKNGERVTSAVFTFPANTDTAGATAIVHETAPGTATYPGTTVTQGPGPNQITVNIPGFPNNKPVESFDIEVDGVVNPSQPGNYAYTVALASSKGSPSTGTHNFTLTAPATAVTVGAVTLSSYATSASVAATVPITLGALGRIAGTTAVGANTISITFPSASMLPTATPATSTVSINGVAVANMSIAGSTLTLTLDASQTVPGGGTAMIEFAQAFGLTTPGTNGTYTLTARTSAQTSNGTSPGISIHTPYLTMSIDSSGFDLGNLIPGVPSSSVTVTVSVSSSDPYTLSRAVGGDEATMGLTYSGVPVGVPLPSGDATYTDVFSATLPWATNADEVMQVTVLYTALQ